jgi:hypothetical protein
MSDKIFASGLIYKLPREGAPEYVKAAISIKTEEFTRFLEEHTKPDGWVNIDVKESQGGKLYAELNTYGVGRPARPERQEEERHAPDYPSEEINPDDIPF